MSKFVTLGFILSIQQSIGNYFLRKEVTYLRRNRQMISLFDAKNIGILFDANDKDEFDLMKKYVTYLRDMKKKVKVLGYFSRGEMQNVSYPKLEYEFFTPKELNWYLKPLSRYIDNFVEEEYDLLIDLNIRDEFPLTYVATASRARFKIGKFGMKRDDVYDMMIKIETDKSLKYFLRQVDSYLQMINTGGASLAANE